MLNPLKQYQKGLNAYRKGFTWGAFLGIVICIGLGKIMFALPIILGMFLGAILMERKLKEDGQI